MSTPYEFSGKRHCEGCYVYAHKLGKHNLKMARLARKLEGVIRYRNTYSKENTKERFPCVWKRAPCNGIIGIPRPGLAEIEDKGGKEAQDIIQEMNNIEEEMWAMVNDWCWGRTSPSEPQPQASPC